MDANPNRGEVGIGYRLSRHITQHWSYRLHRENISENDKKKAAKAREMSLSASEMQNSEALQKWWKTDEGKEHKNFMSFRDEIGSIWGSAVTHTIAYDCRDRRMLPSRGYRVAWTTKVSGLGGGIRHLINTWSASWHHRIVKDCILNLRGSFAHACGLGDTKLRVVDSLMLGGESFRGFDFYGISPARGFAKEAAADACDNFFKHAPDLDYLDSEDKKFVADNKDAIKASLIGDKEWPAGFAKKWGAIARKSAKTNNRMFSSYRILLLPLDTDWGLRYRGREALKSSSLCRFCHGIPKFLVPSLWTSVPPGALSVSTKTWHRPS